MPYIVNVRNLPPGRRLVRRRGTMGFYRPNQAIARGILPGHSALAGFRGRLGGVRFSRLWQDNDQISISESGVPSSLEETPTPIVGAPLSFPAPVELAPEPETPNVLTQPSLPPLTAAPGTVIGTVQSATGTAPLIVNPQGVATAYGTTTGASPTSGISTTWIMAGMAILAIAVLLSGNGGGGKR
jgi:hypothetical protein